MNTQLNSEQAIQAKWVRFNTNEELVHELSVKIRRDLASAIEERGHASLAVSGGSTPITLFEQLSITDIDWHKVTVTLVDERWVDGDHADSNEALVNEFLLQNKAAAAQFISLKAPTSSPFFAEQVIANRLRAIEGLFDAVVLGMGSDGHTASLFPGAEPLQYALEPRHGEPCCGITKAGLTHPRMTLTLPRILDARRIYVHTVGDAKRAVLQEAMKRGSAHELPIRAVLHQYQVPVELYHADKG